MPNAYENLANKSNRDKPTDKNKPRLDSRYLLAVPVILLLCFGLGVQYTTYITGLQPNTAQAVNIIAAKDFTAEIAEGDMVIMLSGELARKGYYVISADTTLRDLLDFAGLKSDSDISDFNMAHTPQHGDQYHVKSKANPLDIEPWLTNNLQPENCIEPADELININTATMQELQQLPNIGEVRAQAIIDYRMKHNGFRHKEEILGVEGIGQKLYEQLINQITV
ncbi:MAG: ComEA family DNA-binding protein [Firmicutes bacterium]|nr:ComEA family DNA-binding protein [Bacillota bacterium]MBQ3200002.1 ComEA family DNA-binding protein [Bacillota bacterium]